MTGQMLFDLSKEAKIQSIMLTLKGKANVLWHEQARGPSRRTGVGVRRRQRGAPRGRRRTYSAELNFFNISHVVMQTNDGKAMQSRERFLISYELRFPLLYLSTFCLQQMATQCYLQGSMCFRSHASFQ